MYNIKKNSCRKEGYKFKKTGYLKKKQNTIHFQYNKYNKYKQRYSHSNKFSNYSYENNSQNNTFLEKDSGKFKSNKKNDLIEVNESEFTYEDENKEKSSSNENSIANDYLFQEKTNEKTDEKNNDSFNNIQDDKSLTNEQDLNSSENNSIILPNQNSFCKTNSQICSDDKENIDPNIKFKRYNTCNFSNITSINLSSQDFKEAFYVPKRLNNLYNMYSNNNQINLNINERQQNENNFRNLSSTSIKDAFSLNNILNNNNNNNIFQNNNNQNINPLTQFVLNNNNNNFLFCKQNINLNINKSSSIDSIQPFNLYDSQSSNSLRKMNSFDSFHSLKTQISGSIFENEKEKENTDILEIYVKLPKNKSLLFKIRRYDDMFKTVKIFCEINKLDTKLIRPFIIYIIKALNSIYGIYNLNLKSEEIRFLKDIKEYFYNDENNEENNKDNEKKEHDNNSNFEINDSIY